MRAAFRRVRETMASLLPYYLWIKAFHVIALIAWMAGMLYLPRLYVYHCETVPGSPESERFKTMERRLLRAIINPAMIAAVLSGIALATIGDLWPQTWLSAKLVLVLGLGAVHGAFAKWRKDFAADRRSRSQRFYRIWNEVPTLLLIGIVILAVVKPL